MNPPPSKTSLEKYAIGGALHGGRTAICRVLQSPPTHRRLIRIRPADLDGSMLDSGGGKVVAVRATGAGYSLPTPHVATLPT